MRWTLRILVALALLFLMAWVAAEALLVYGARQIEKNGDLRIGRADMLIDPTRIGASYGDILYEQESSGIALSEISIWLRPWRLNEVNITLPSKVAGKDLPFTLGLTEGKAHARLSPLHNFRLKRAGVSALGLDIDEETVLGPFDITAKMTNFGSVIPLRPSLAYQVDASIKDIRLASLATLIAPPQPQPQPTDPQEVSGKIQGRLVVWLQTDTQALSGLFFRDLTISAGANDLLIRGHAMQDAQGRLQGKIALDFTDPREFMLSLQKAGLLPRDYVHLVASMLENLATDSEELETERPTEIYSSNLHEQIAYDRSTLLPPKPKSSRRIILTLKDNELFTGSVPVSALLRRLENHPSAAF